MGGVYTNLYSGYRQLKFFLKGKKNYRLLRQVKKEQWLPPEEIRQLQLARLKKMLNYATENSKYYKTKYADYRDVIANFSSLDDLQKLPLFTREQLQENFENILVPGVKGTYRDTSGGSTGNPVIFYHDDWYKSYGDALEQLFLVWNDLSFGDKTAIFWGAVRDIPELTFKEKLFVKLERVKFLNSFEVSEENLEAFLKILHEWQPAYIYGYATSLELAANYIMKKDNYKIRPRVVRSSAEVLYPHQEEVIQKAFGCPVYNYYGSREVNHLAAECPKREGLHVFASGRIIELVDDSGKHVPPGEIGQIAVTDFTNFCFPFIRYLNGDSAIAKAEQCSCGRGYPLLKNVTGRTFEILTFGGKYLHGHFFAHLFLGYRDVKKFQIVQESDNLLVIKLVAPNKDINLEPILQRIQKQVGPEIKIEVNFVDHIPPLKSGKHRYTINKTVNY